MTFHVTEPGPKRPGSGVGSLIGNGRVGDGIMPATAARRSARVGRRITTTVRPPALSAAATHGGDGATGGMGASATIIAVAENEPVERVLVVVAHPDDCDFGCAATTARWTSEGITVSYCIVTDGDAGGSDRSISRPEMARIRRREQTAAAAAVEVTDITFLGYPDGRLASTIELRRDISRVIRQKKPQRVLTQSPERNYGRIFASHPDHLAAGEATLCAVYPDARNPFAHPELLEVEGLEPYTVAEVYLMASMQGDVVIDVTESFERKLEALKCHVSQYDDWEQLSQRLHDWARANAEQHELGEGRYAESFLRVPTG